MYKRAFCAILFGSTTGCFSPDEIDDSAGTGSSGGTAGSDSATTTASTTATATSAGTTTANPTTTTTAGTGGSTGGVQPDNCYDPMFYPFAGQLCGPGTQCGILIDERVTNEIGFRNGAPGIGVDLDCQPAVLFSLAEGGFNGRFSVRTGPDMWAQEDTPFPVARGQVIYDVAASQWQVLANGGNFVSEYWTRDTMWNLQAGLPGDTIVWAGSVAGLGDAQLHVGYRNSDSEILYGRFNGAWNTQLLGDGSSEVRSAVFTDGTAHITWWRAMAGQWELMWATPTIGPEVAVPLGSNFLSVAQHAVTVLPNGGTGAPQIFAARDIGGGLEELVLASRTGPNAWDTLSVVTEVPGTTCPQPTFVGQTCDFDFTRVRPLGIVGSQNGDVRMLYGSDRNLGTFVSNCPMPPQFCFWDTQVDNSTYELRLAWPDGAGTDSQVITTDRAVRSLSTWLDAFGDIHLGLYTGTGDLGVEYLRIGFVNPE